MTLQQNKKTQFNTLKIFSYIGGFVLLVVFAVVGLAAVGRDSIKAAVRVSAHSTIPVTVSVSAERIGPNSGGLGQCRINLSPGVTPSNIIWRLSNLRRYVRYTRTFSFQITNPNNINRVATAACTYRSTAGTINGQNSAPCNNRCSFSVFMR